MTILKYNDKSVVLAPDLTLELQHERDIRNEKDLQVVAQTSELVSLVNSRIDSLVQRMNNFESGVGTEWAVPLQTEKTNRIQGDIDSKNLATSLNTAMSNRVDGLFNDIVAVEDRVAVLEQADTTIVRQGDTATLENLKVNQKIDAQTGEFTNNVTVGSLTNLSDHHWTKIRNDGDNKGIWFKREGDMVSVRFAITTGAAVSNNVLCTIPTWAQMSGLVNYMFVVSSWNVDPTSYQLQVHGNTASDPNRNIIEMLKSPYNTKFEFTINYAVGELPR